MICIFSLFHWCIVKADPNPYEPVDTSLQKNSNEKSTTSDTLELARQKIYSTIEYVQSIDTSEEGVFIRINTKRTLLRKLTEAEKNGGGMRSDLDKEAIKNLLKLLLGQNSTNAQHGVWRYWGRTLLASAVVRYQLQFRLDVNNLALVLNFNF